MNLKFWKVLATVIKENMNVYKNITDKIGGIFFFCWNIKKKLSPGVMDKQFSWNLFYVIEITQIKPVLLKTPLGK